MVGTTKGIVGTTGSGLISGNIGESGGARTLSKSGPGTITLSGSNSYTGGTRVIAGTLVARGANALGAAGGPLTVSSGTLDVSGNSFTVGALAGGGTILSNTTGAVTLSTTSAVSGTFSGVIADGSGSLGLTKLGT